MGKMFNDVLFVVTRNGEVLKPETCLKPVQTGPKKEPCPGYFKKFKDAEKLAKTRGEGCKIEMRGFIYDEDLLFDGSNSITLKKNVKKQCRGSKIGFTVVNEVGCECLTTPSDGAPFSTYKKAKKVLKEKIKCYKKDCPDMMGKFYINLEDVDDGFVTVIKANVSSTKKALKKQKDRDDDYER